MTNNLDAMTFIEVKNLSKTFDQFLANDSISMNIKKGEIHALLGENGAGKSTLVKCLYGVVKPTAGQILINDNHVTINNPREARSYGIGMVFQHFSLFPALTVSENILISLDKKITKKHLEDKISITAKQWGLPIEPTKKVLDLSVGEQQRVEIIRCLLQNPKLLIMDEPTSVLSPQEINQLFKVLRKLANSGCSILYISHKLNEIKQIASKVTILRSGKVISSTSTSKISTTSMAEKMIGKKVKKITKISKNSFLNSPTAISINNLNRKKLSQFGTELKKISFNVKYGEILGIAGVAGNGQVELMNALSGETLGDPDEIIFEDKKIGNTNIKFRRSLGLEFVPEERNGHATVPDITLTENTFLTFYNTYSKNNNFLDDILLSSNMSSNDSKSIINDNDVRCPYSNPLADQLSGGNLQKFIVGRSLKANPKVLIISQPTWGVDIGAASEIRSKLLQLAKVGKAIILISQDLDEIYEISNNICVINNGSLSTPKITSKISAKDIGILMGMN